MKKILNSARNSNNGFWACVLFLFLAATGFSIRSFGMGMPPSDLPDSDENGRTFSTRTVTEVVTAPMKFVRWYDDQLSAGTEHLIYNGTPGQDLVTVEEYVVGDVVIHRREISRKVITKGTAGAKRSGDRENTVGRVMRMEATAYHPSDGDGNGITATGTTAARGTVAVDPSVIKLGSSVFVPGYGMAVAADTGGDIVGNRIDLCMEKFDECWEFGRKNIEVFVAGI